MTTHAPGTGEPDCTTIGDGDVRLDLDAARGGRVAQITAHGVELLIGSEASDGDPLRWGSYPMVPWAGRVRHGRFEFGGAVHRLPTGADGHAMHGVGFLSRWTVGACSPTGAEFTLRLPNDGSWPFGGLARQTFDVTGDVVTLTIEVSAGELAMPAMVGWHPWFRKPSVVEFAPTAMYRRHEGVAVAELVDVPPGPWDDCFVNTAPIVAVIDGVTVALSSDCTDWVVYDERPEATCIEPQSAPPDAFNIGGHVLGPHETLRRWYRMRFDPPAR
ncbi:MAG TPA: hypothetical protein VIS05_13345 [Ilumatobacter sp.]